jgi:hypothetical protein
MGWNGMSSPESGGSGSSSSSAATSSTKKSTILFDVVVNKWPILTAHALAWPWRSDNDHDDTQHNGIMTNN